MKRSVPTTRTALAGAFAAAMMLAAGGALAQNFPSPNSGANEVDPVTGYRCVTPGCDTLRMPNANCLCQKENPAERNLADLRLTCSTKEGGQWVACPVRPPFGN